jgi:hypothetical protein
MKRRIARLQVRRAQQAAADDIARERACVRMELAGQRHAIQRLVEGQDQRAIQMMEQALRSVLDKVGRVPSYKMPLEEVVTADWRHGNDPCSAAPRTVASVTGDQVIALWTLLGRLLPGLPVPTLYSRGEKFGARCYVFQRIPR